MTDFFAGLDSDLDNAQMKATETTGLRGDMRGQFADAVDALAFMMAGKATVTLVSKKTGNRFTFRVSVSPDGQCHFVALLSGPDNTNDYQYMGRISRQIYFHGRKVARPGDISVGAPSARAFAWTWQQLVRGTLPDSLEIWHEGRCGRCARKLTVPASIERGFGPECADRMEGEM
jgi:hypothetical protein